MRKKISSPLGVTGKMFGEAAIEVVCLASVEGAVCGLYYIDEERASHVIIRFRHLDIGACNTSTSTHRFGSGERAIAGENFVEMGKSWLKRLSLLVVLALLEAI